MSQNKNCTIAYYNQHAEKFLADTLVVDMQPLYDEFLPHLPSGACILDIGCGSGRDALAFTKLGFKMVAFDASQAMVAQAQRLVPQADVVLADFADYRPKIQLDGLWACASLLHVPKAQLQQTFERCASWLKPHGVFYCSFKYGDQETHRNGRDFTDLTESLLAEHLTETNLNIIKTWVTGDKRPGRSHEQWLNALLMKADAL